jgi:cob(I)alamin adenosyltransferase
LAKANKVATVKRAMSIVTKTGDSGTTALMFGRRVPKNHPRVEACGAVDELNAAIGAARAAAKHRFIRENLAAIQEDLILLMGELGVLPEDLPRYFKGGYSPVTPAMTAKFDALVAKIESRNVTFKGWAIPGQTNDSAALDVARTICRRAERRVCALHESRGPVNPESIVFLNRLSDLLWLFARWVETKAKPAGRHRTG